MLSISIAHTTFCIGFIAIIVRARLQGMDESIFEAARDLGATPWQTFHQITLPLIKSAIIAGALMSFTLSTMILSLLSLLKVSKNLFCRFKSIQ